MSASVGCGEKCTQPCGKTPRENMFIIMYVHYIWERWFAKQINKFSENTACTLCPHKDNVRAPTHAQIYLLSYFANCQRQTDNVFALANASLRPTVAG